MENICGGVGKAEGARNRYRYRGNRGSDKEELQRGISTMHANKLLHMLTELTIAVLLYRQM